MCARPIFRSLATNLGTTFKVPKNLVAIGEDSQKGEKSACLAKIDIVKVKGTQKYPFSSYKSPQCVVIVVVVVYI